VNKVSKYNPKEVAMIRPKSFDLIAYLETTLKNDDIWERVEPYLLPPGFEPKRSYDEVRVYDILKANDPKVIGNFGIDYVSKKIIPALKRMNFEVTYGKITDTLEPIGYDPKKIEHKDPAEEPIQTGEPDVE
jgi:hypothetical protein